MLLTQTLKTPLRWLLPSCPPSLQAKFLRLILPTLLIPLLIPSSIDAAVDFAE